MKIIEFNANDVQDILVMAFDAANAERPLRIAVDGDRLLFKVGGGMWTAPMGYPVDSNYQPIKG